MSYLIYLVAGEPSGDRLGADLMRGLRVEDPGVRFAGLGGTGMQAAGLETLFDISELSVMGFTEVLPRLPRLLRRLAEVTEDVLDKRPDALITIDSPSFSLRIAKRVRKSASGVNPLILICAVPLWKLSLTCIMEPPSENRQKVQKIAQCLHYPISNWKAVLHEWVLQN